MKLNLQHVTPYLLILVAAFPQAYTGCPLIVLVWKCFSAMA